MKETWEVAEFLEDFIKNAEPDAVLRRLMNNARKSNIVTAFLTDPGSDMVEAQYIIPVEMAMQGVEGSVEEVVELLRTGLSENQFVELRERPDKTRLLVLIRKFHDGALFDDVQGMIMQHMEAMKKKSIEQAEQRARQQPLS